MAEESLRFVVPHRPVPKPRPRVSGGKYPFKEVVKILDKAAKNNWKPSAIALEIEYLFEDRKLNVYSAAHQAVYEEKVKEAFLSAIIHNEKMITQIPYTKAFSCVGYFYFDDDVDAEDLEEDVDNLIKMPLDALNGVAWVDDKKAVHKEGAKITRCDVSYSEIEITFLGDTS